MLTESSWQANTALSHSRHLQVWPEPEETRMRAKKFMMDMLYKETQGKGGEAALWQNLGIPRDCRNENICTYETLITWEVEHLVSVKANRNFHRLL